MSLQDDFAKAKAVFAVAEAEYLKIKHAFDAAEARSLTIRFITAGYFSRLVNKIDLYTHVDFKLVWMNARPEEEPDEIIPKIYDCFRDINDRVSYTAANADVALCFTDDGTPRLFAIDNSGIDHETLFELGRMVK